MGDRRVASPIFCEGPRGLALRTGPGPPVATVPVSLSPHSRSSCKLSARPMPKQDVCSWPPSSASRLS
jgi:hypothetical protein